MQSLSFSRLLCIFGFAAFSLMSLVPTTYAEDPRVRLHRLRKANSPVFAPKWSHSRVVANILYRCPLSETLGFIALKKDTADPQKFAQLSQYFATLAEERDAYNDSEIRGSRFPDALETELAALRSRMLEAVESLYGDAVRHELTDHLTRIYELHRMNIVSGSIHFH